jgi:PAS domain S-box-containing protein
MRCYPFIYISSSEWDARNRDYYIDARDKKELIWSEPFFDIGGGGWVITCSMPLYDKNGDFFGVQCIDITLDTIVKNIIGVELYDTGYAFLINEKGNIIALPDRAEKDLFITYEGKVPTQEEIEKAKTTLTFSLLEHPNEEFVGLIKKAIEGETIMEKIKFDKEKYLTFVPIESTGWAVGIVAPVGEVLAPVRNAIIIALIVAIVGALGASLFAGKRFAQPLVKLSETSEKIARGDLLARVSIKSSIKEFSEVSNDINRMVDGLQSNIEELKQALDSYSKVLNEVALGNLSARVNTTQLKGAYSLLGETLNSIVSILEYDTEELKKKDTELSQTVSLCSGVLDKVTQQGDLSTRVNVSKLKGKYKQLGSDINLMADSLQNKINELKQTKGEIEESRVFLQQIMTNIPDILVVTDNEGHWLQVSPSFEELTGFKIKEVLGKKTTEQPVYKDLPEGIELNKQMWERVYKGEVVKGIEIPWRTKRGKKIILSASERTLKDSKGKDMGRVFVARDITRSRKHE